MPPVEIRLQGHLDPQWSQWLGDLKIRHIDNDQTLLTGSIADQAALYGILKKIRDLDLRLVSVVIDKPCNLIDH